MRAWVLEKNFGLENLKLLNRQVPEDIAPYDVMVKIKACSLNYRDLLVLNGDYNKNQELPLVPLSDGAGEVIKIGEKVRDFIVGDKVCLTFSQKWPQGSFDAEALKNTLGSPLDGVLQEKITTHEDGLIKFPPHLSYVEASTLPCAGVTAFNAIFSKGFLSSGDYVLLEGTGGVSLFSLQFANILGLKSILLTSSQEKIEKVKKLNPSYIINYKEDTNWHKAALKITNNIGVRAVIEVGGANTFQKAIDTLSREGVLFLIGILGGVKLEVNLLPIIMKGLQIQGIFVGAKSVFLAMNRVIEHTLFRPVIDKVFSFNSAPQAFSYFKCQNHFGKVCIEF